MTDPTPEERADSLANTECPHWSEAVPFTCRSECPRCVGKEIREAVAAERKAVVERVKIATVGWALSYAMYEDLLAAIRKDK